MDTPTRPLMRSNSEIFLSYVSYGNAHIYGGNINAWSGAMQYWLPIFKESTPGKPTVITEQDIRQSPILSMKPTAAKYNLNLLFENALNGVSETYLFELADLDSSASDTDYDVHFGQFHSDWSPKIGATTLHSLNTILKNAGSGSTSSTLNYKVTGLPSAGHSFLLGSSSNFDLAVWIDATVFDSASNTAITAPTYAPPSAWERRFPAW